MLLVTWDGVLICVSLIVAFIASFTALDTAGRVAVSRGWLARLWLVVSGTATVSYTHLTLPTTPYV